ncbi:hypothetical protein [Rhizobium sp. NZLR11]|uniref:hypothetical protein n=1 Tax=Rhizobium sp. NZLR11 TaxID=2731098 RepID=UPI001C83C5C4|nr:hypothetical protein [Rhizobium sp. NZLR11]MBX5206724.1 hypothetical protein [Rhizobium sp. NZLR11]
MATLVEKYKGEKIERDEDGFFWRKDGYFESAARCRVSIDDWIAEETEFYRDIDTPADTDCLTQPYWER